MLLLTGTSSVKTEQRSISSWTKLSSCSSSALTQLASKYCNIHFALDHMEKAIKKTLLKCLILVVVNNTWVIQYITSTW